MYGNTGKILIVDVSRKSFQIVEKDETYVKKIIGGALMCAALFEELIDGHDAIDPLGPENPIIFATGPMARGKVCGATRVNIMSMAPESVGIYLSQAGGEFGPSIKHAGFDALAVTGISEIPVVLTITNDSVGFEDAGDLWGMDRVAAYKKIIHEMGNDYSVASIGPAGENMVRHANIMFEPDHYAGRGGLGAVLGSKRIKAIAVRGDQDVIFKDPHAVRSINHKGGQEFAENIKKSPRSFLGMLRRLGTFGLLELNRKTGNLPTRNFNSGSPDDPEFLQYKHDTIKSDIVGKINPCKNCFVACKKTSKANPEYSSLAEYESVAILGPNIGLENDFKTCLKACELCNRLGLDTISTGNIIAWLMDCFENKALDAESMGYSINFGDGEKIIKLIENIALRKDDLGNLLADGINRAVDKLGSKTKPYLRFVKGIGIPAHMPRKKPGIGFAYLHGPNPNDHMKLEHDWIASDPASLKKFNLNVKSAPDALDEAKLDIMKTTQAYFAAMDTLSLCLFVFGPGNVYTFEEIIGMLNAATGFELTFEDLMKIGERAIQLQRKLFLRLGGKDEDFLPFMEKEIPKGPSKGAKINKADFENARSHYYKVMGWDKNGQVLPKTLKRFEI